MKKVLLIALGACMITASSFAQKQTGGEDNFQVLFAPLGGSPISINGISFRKFNATGDAAWRVNLFLGFTHTTGILSQADTGTFANGGGGAPEADVKASGMVISIRPGYEKHFAGTDRLSPYIGAEVLFSIASLTTDSDHIVTNGTPLTTPPVAATGYNVLTTESKGKGSVLGTNVGTTFGVNLIAGFDYYIANGLSLGAEFGWGFSTTSAPDAKSQRVDFNRTTGAAEVTDNLDQKQGSSWTIAPNAIAQLKLGWLFGK